jgi:hypothetical protein
MKRKERKGMITEAGEATKEKDMLLQGMSHRIEEGTRNKYTSNITRSSSIIYTY